MGRIAKTDVELVEASLRGEHEAFGHLVARYQDVVCAVTYSSTGDQVLSEDVAQDTFIAAWRQLDRLRSGSRLRPWLCGIARNLARTARKRRRREPLVDADEHVAPGANPFDLAARGDVERVVRDALARIPDAYREALVLYYREDLSIREVAETLDLSEAAVMQRLSRGRRYLADSVTELVERSLRSERRQRDLVASVLASITAIAIPSRVDASPAKGSTMLKFAIATTTVVAVGTTAYLVHSHRSDPPRTTATATAKAPALRYGGGTLGLAHAPALGPSSAPAQIRSRSVAEADLAYLPADSDAVIGVNFAQLRQSSLWQQYLAPKLGNASGLHEIQALCGFDPVASLGSISIGIKGLGEDDTVSGVVLIHGFERTKARSCFDKKAIPNAEQSGTKIAIDGDVVMLSMPEADKDAFLAFTFIDDTTALIVVGPDARTKESVLRIAQGKSDIHTSSRFAETLQVVNTDASVWFMLAADSPIVNAINVEAAPYAPIKLGSVYVSVNVTNTLALDAGLQLGSPATVAMVVSKLQAELAQRGAADEMARFFDQFDVAADGSDLIVSLAMSGDQIMQLVTTIATTSFETESASL